MRKIVDLFIIMLGYYMTYTIVCNKTDIYGVNAICVIGIILSAAYLTHMYVNLALYKIKRTVTKISNEINKKKEEKAEDTAEKA